MQNWQWLRTVKGWASRQVGFTLGGKQRQKSCDSREIIPGFIWGHRPGPGCPKITLHVASQAVLMVDLQLTKFMYCLMKNLSRNLQENIEQWPNYSHFCKEWRAPLAQRCPDDDWHQKLVSGVSFALECFAYCDTSPHLLPNSMSPLH